MMSQLELTQTTSSVGSVDLSQVGVSVAANRPEQHNFASTAEYSQTGPSESSVRHYVVLGVLTAVVIFERIGFYSLQSALSQLGLLSSSAETMLLILGLRCGGQFIFPLVGAWIGECLLGVHLTAVIGTILELIGGGILIALRTSVTSLIPETNSTNNTEFDAPFSGATDLGEGFTSSSETTGIIITGLVFVMLGLALSRSNYAMLAAMQVPEKKLIDCNFFLWYFFVLDLGTTIGMSLAGWASFIGRSIFWTICFFLSLLGLTAVRFISEDRLNQVYRKGFRKLLKCLKPKYFRRKVTANSSEEAIFEQQEADLSRLYRHMVKMFILIGLNLTYQLAYAVLAMWTVQERWFRLYPNLPWYWIVDLYDPISVLIVIPIAVAIIHYVLKPKCRNFIKSLNFMTIGMVLIAVSCFVTAVHEGTSEGENAVREVATQFPQFFILGLAEMFCFAKGFEFVYTETPKYLKNQMLGLYFTVIGCGYLIMLGATEIVAANPHTDVDTVLGPKSTKIIVFHCVVGAIQLLAVIPFAYFAYRFQYRDWYEYSVSACIDESYRSREPTFGGDTVSVASSVEQDDGCCQCIPQCK